MIWGFIIGIVVAHALTFLHIDQLTINGVRDLIRIDIGHNGYYLMMGVMGGISGDMIGGFLSGFVVAYLFTFVNLDHIIIEGVKEWFKYDLSRGAYYLLFAIIGSGFSFLEVLRIILSPLFSIVKKKSIKTAKKMTT